MNLLGHDILTFIETGGILAPLLFILFHLLRPLFFLPVVFICVFGGVFFGTVAGTIYSIIGITLSSILFYMMLHAMPRTFKRIAVIKEKMFGKHSLLTTPQITILRLIPFIHFQLLSFCLVEISPTFKDYTKSSFFTNIPVAILYTLLGQSITNLTKYQVILIFSSLLFLAYCLRRKEISIQWNDFFRMNRSEANELL